MLHVGISMYQFNLSIYSLIKFKPFKHVPLRTHTQKKIVPKLSLVFFKIIIFFYFKSQAPAQKFIYYYGLKLYLNASVTRNSILSSSWNREFPISKSLDTQFFTWINKIPYATFFAVFPIIVYCKMCKIRWNYAPEKI